MKNLFILLVIIFMFFGCTENSTNSGGGTKSFSSMFVKPSLDEKVQIFPIQESYAQGLLRKISIGHKMYAIMPVDNQKALDDWDVGCMYAENSYEWAQSVKHQEINYLNVGAEYGVNEKLFVNFEVEVTEYSINANPIKVYARAKGSNGAWTLLSPTLATSDNEIIVTDNDGIIEWYADNNSHYDWVDENAEPGVHVYGHQTIKVFSDGAARAL